MKNKVLAGMLCICMVILSACGGNNAAAESAAETVQESTVADNTKSDAPVSDPAPANEKPQEEQEPELPEGQYLLSFDPEKMDETEHAYYQVGDQIKPGSYHLEDYSDDFKCFTIVNSADYVRGSETEQVVIQMEYSATDSEKSGFEADQNIAIITNGAASMSGSIVRNNKPEMINDETVMVLTTDQMFIVCISGTAKLVLDEEYDAAKMAEVAKLPDFGSWNDREYTNEGLGIHLNVPFNRDHMYGWRAPHEGAEKEYFDSAYIRNANAPYYIDVIDEVGTKVIGISSYANSSLNVYAYDTTVPVGASLGNRFYGVTPEEYIKDMIEIQNKKAKEDPDHYMEASEVDDHIFGHDAKMITTVSESEENVSLVDPDADYVTTYESVWAYQEDRYLVVARLKFSFGQKNGEDEATQESNRTKYDECMEIVGDILPEL